jgi:hypothetical protein
VTCWSTPTAPLLPAARGPNLQGSCTKGGRGQQRERVKRVRRQEENRTHATPATEGEGGAWWSAGGAHTHNNPHTALPGTVQARQLPAHVCCKLSLEDAGAVQQLTVWLLNPAGHCDGIRLILCMDVTTPPRSDKCRIAHTLLEFPLQAVPTASPPPLAHCFILCAAPPIYPSARSASSTTNKAVQGLVRMLQHTHAIF